MEKRVRELELKIDSQKIIIEKQRKHMLDLSMRADILNNENMALYDFNACIYLTMDSQCTIQKVNFQATILFGTSRKQLTGGNFLNFICSHSTERFKTALSTLLESQFNQTCEVELFQPGGVRKQANLTLALLKDHSIRLCLMDMTHTRQLEMQAFELKKSLYLVNNVLACTNEAVAALDSELYFRVINHKFSVIFSQIFAHKIYVGMNILQILQDFPNEKAQFSTAYQTAFLGTKTALILDNHEHTHEIYYRYEITLTPILNHYTKKNDLILCINNLTSQRLKERQHYKQQADLRLACRLSAMGEMGSAFSHEINQPLTAINAYSRSCLYILNSSASHETICSQLLFPLKQLVAQAEHAGRVVVNMKDLLQDSGFNAEESDINALVKETLSILYYEIIDFKVKITFHLEDDLPCVMANHIYIMQIILNLTRNGIEAMHAANTKDPELTIETRQLNDDIAVYITDNGPGVPIDIQDTILNAYFTTKQQGTGIGLGVCRSLIEAHGGKLSLHKNLKNGACFSFTLPIHHAPHREILEESHEQGA